MPCWPLICLDEVQFFYHTMLNALAVSQQNTAPHTATPFNINLSREKIAASFLSQNWDWSEVHSVEWRNLFYDELLLRSRLTSPLTAQEAGEYLNSIALLPTQGFFPRPDIAAKSLALSSRLLTVCPPLTSDACLSSTRCAPLEHSADARTHIPKGSFLGFHIGWISQFGPPDASAAYSVCIQHRQSTKVVRCWDPFVACDTRADIFLLSHINEHIWMSEGSSNPNNTGSSASGQIWARQHIRRE